MPQGPSQQVIGRARIPQLLSIVDAGRIISTIFRNAQQEHRRDLQFRKVRPQAEALHGPLILLASFQASNMHKRKTEVWHLTSQEFPMPALPGYTLC